MKHINSFRSKKKHLKMKNWIRDMRGTTLVELIVTFALLGLFMTAASSMLTSTLQLFTRMQATSRAITVSDMLLDKISGEITAAILPISTSTDGYYFWLDPKDKPDGDGKSRWVVFRNRSKSPIAIFAAEPDPDSGKADVSTMGKGELFIRYYAVSGNELKKVPELDWHLDSRTYMGYRIKDLWFEREKTDHPNVVKINLTLENDRTGFEYTTFRYAENYNYDFASNYMCERTEIKAQADAGKTNFPVQANEFKIERSSGGGETPDPGPEKYECFIYYRTNGTDEWKVWPDFRGYVAEAKKIVMVMNETEPEEEGIIKLKRPQLTYYTYDENSFYYTEVNPPMEGEGSVESRSKNKIYLQYWPSNTELVEFKVASRVKQEDGTYINLKEESYRVKIESQFTLTPEPNLEVGGKIYKCLSGMLDFKVDANAADPGKHYFDYELVPENDSLIFEDSTGKKHEVFTNLDWEKVKAEVVYSSGYQFEDRKAWLMSDESGFYIVINGTNINSGNVNLDTKLSDWRGDHKYKISDNARMLTSADLVGTDHWKNDKIPKAMQDFAFIDGKYYYAGSGVGLWDVPPASSWVLIPGN